MREVYGDASKASGSRIVSFCGFDSIPSDLAVFAAVRALRKQSGKHDPQTIDKASTWFTEFGLFTNNETVHTMVENFPFLRMLRCFLRRPFHPFLVDDPLALTHPNVRKDEAMIHTKNRLARAEWYNQVFPFMHSFLMFGCSAPSPMAIVNAKVVHESALALDYASANFTYYERYLPVGFRGSRQLKALSMIAVWINQIRVYLAIFLCKLPLIGSWVATMSFPVTGPGMSDVHCQDECVEVYAEVERSLHHGGDDDKGKRSSSSVSSPTRSRGKRKKGKKKIKQGTSSVSSADRKCVQNKVGSSHTKKVSKANCFLRFKGDPGNWITAQCVCEAALCLLLKEDENKTSSDATSSSARSGSGGFGKRNCLPPNSDDGFGSPAEILGDALLHRLVNNKIRPVQCTTNVRMETDKMEWSIFD